MLIWIPWPSNRPVNSSLVNCEPWSLLNISGFRPNDSASSSASRQKPTSQVFDNRQASTCRLYQSRIATRNRCPLAIGK